MEDVALPPTEAPAMVIVLPAQTAAPGPAVTNAGWLIVTVIESTADAQPPAATIVLVSTYEPGAEEERSICPVEVFTLRPEGLAVNAPALAPAPKTGEGSTPVWQKAAAPDVNENVATGALVMVNETVSALGQGPLVL